MNQFIFVVSGPSGSGKTTIINAILQKTDNLTSCITTTTREPRGDETHGKHYYFITKEDFKAKINNDEFIEHMQRYDNYYGLTKSEVARNFALNKNVVLNIDYIGFENIKKLNLFKVFGVFIKPKSIKVLEERLIARGDDIMDIKKRISTVNDEINHASLYDNVFVNDDLNTCVEEILQAYKNFK